MTAPLRSRSRLRRAIRLAVLALSLAAIFPPLGASAGEDRASYRSAWSCSRRFLVTGTNSAHLANAARWAEDIADAIERSFGIKTSPDYDAVFRIVLHSDNVDSVSNVLKSHAVRDNSQFQQLDLGPLGQVDWEEAIQSFCFLLLSRHVTDLWLAGNKAESPAPVPDWLAVGLASNLDPALRRRDRRIVLRISKKKQLPSFSEISTWHSLPEGNDSRKSISSSATAWLTAKPTLRKTVEPLTVELAAGRELTVDLIAEKVLKLDSSAEIDSDWSAWVDDQQSIISPLDGITTDLTSDLKALLVAQPGKSGIPESGALQGRTTFENLVRVKTKRWVNAFCKQKTHELEVFCIGRPSEVVETLEAYRDFLDALAEKQRDGSLLRLLVRAEAMLRELERTATAAEQAQGMTIPAESRPSPLTPKR